MIFVKMLSIELNAENDNNAFNSDPLHKPPTMINIAQASEKGTAGEKDSTKGKRSEEFRKIHKKGIIYYTQGNYSKALKQFKKLLLFKLNSATVYYNLGLTYYRTGNKKQALKAFQRTLSINPDHPSANKMIDRTIQKVLKMPVIFYDYRCNETNPNFQARDTRKDGELISIDKSKLVIEREGYKQKYSITKNTKVYGLGGVITDGLSKMTNIPKGSYIKFQVDPKYHFNVAAIEDPSYEYQTNYAEGKKGMIFEHLNKDRKPVLKTYRQSERNYRLNEWYYPSGIKGTDAEFVYDIMNDRWKWKGLKPFKGSSTEFVGKNFDPKDSMANVVIYDYLKFKLTKSETITTNKGLIRTIETYVFNSPLFFPVDRKGFKENKRGKAKSHNYSYAMEVHTSFLYRGGEYFNFRGDDDIYLFIDGKLAMDLGGMHSAQIASVEIDKIPGLKKGNTYSFDLFFAERQTTSSSLRIEGTFIFEEPDPVVLGIIADRETFIPDDEQVKFTMIGVSLESENKEWLVGIWDEDDNLVKSFKGKGKIRKVLYWDGKDKKGNPVKPDKQFNIMARGIDQSKEEWESNIVTVKSIMKLVKGEEIVIRGIYFAPFSAEITPGSKIALERIYKLLVEYPKVRLLVKGHVSPFSWTKEKLLELSQNRAESVRKYLIDKGIDPERLEAKGFGDTDPFTDEDTNEARSLNRRTEFEVISSEE